MPRYTHFILFLLSSLSVHGQHWTDSIRHALRQEPSFGVAINNRSTFIIAEKVTLYGLEGGFSYGRELRFYSGIYGLSNRHRTWLLNDPRFEQDSVLQSSSVGNVSVGAELTVHRNKGLTVRTPVQLGIGTQRTRYTFTDGDHIDEHDLMFPLEVGTHATFRLSRYVYVGGGVGYRLQFGGAEVLRRSAPYYTLGLGIALQTLYNDLKEHY